jgi:hypothetical protein
MFVVSLVEDLFSDGLLQDNRLPKQATMRNDFFMGFLDKFNGTKFTHSPTLVNP